MREWLFLECGSCGNRYYRTSKNNRSTFKVEKKKYCNVCREHTLHKEKKK
jgi:large subunit ribosomal protein L33